jgi:uncharacterized membrane protein
MSLYLFLKWIHVLAAITALGANLTYVVWIRLGERSQPNLLHSLRGVRFLDDRIANPAYGVVVVTGLLMVWVNKLSLLTAWITIPLILVIVVAGLGIGAYSPALRRQIQAAEAEGPSSASYRAASRQAQLFGAITTVLVVAIVFVMVVKPVLWS